MEVDGIQTQACKLSRIGNSRDNSNKIGRKGGNQFQDEEEESGEGNRANDTNNAIVGGFHVGSENGRLQAWHSSRIFRVSRASGGKDRHSKVLTAKGLRDRRVRLSVSTAIQFYDLQDRLGYDQPSKAVEWLIKAASVAIADLPPLNTTFPETPKQLSDEKRATKDPRFDPTEMELDADLSFQQQQHNISLSKSGCSSTSETSKGSGLSLSRSDIRVKARERARERTAKDKEKEKPEEPHRSTHHQQNALSSSFTELLTGCAQNSHSSPSLSAAQQNSSFSNFAIKQNRYIPSTHETDYFTSGLFGSSSMRSNPYSSGFPGQTHFANASPIPQFSVTGDHHQEQHQFFLSDHMTDAAAAAAGASGNEYNLNFTIAPGIAGFNRGTLQSNSTQSPLPHLQQRLSSPADGPSMPFFIGNLGSASAAPPIDNQFSSRFDRGLHLYYGHDERHSDLKGKDKG